MSEIAAWQRDYASHLTIALISRGAVETNRTKMNEHRLMYILLQKDRETAKTYLADGTPSAVIVQPNGTIGSRLAAGADEIRDLVTQIVGTPAQVRGQATLPDQMDGCADCNWKRSAPAQNISISPKIGERAPAFKLRDLSGKMIDLTDYRGSQALVLFWNPGCGFCNQMLNDLKVWESNPPQGAPKLLVVSTGSVSANQSLGLQAPVVLDEGFSVGRLFGASGTPSAILIDEKGDFASAIAVGAPAVLALAFATEPGHRLV
jgi:peroxiredoxin